MNFSQVRSPATVDRQAAVAAAAAAIAASAGAGLAFDPRAIVVVAVLMLGVAYAVTAVYRPAWAIAALLAALAFIPAAGLPVRSAVHPSLLLGLVIIGLAAGGLAFRAKEGHPPGVSAIDVGVAVLALGVLSAAIAGTQPKVQVLATTMLWFVPFATGRIVARAGHTAALAKLVVLFAVALIPLAVMEAVMHRNLFFSTFSYVQPLESESLNKFERLGHLRVRAGWRHPILFAMFLSAAASLAAVLALRTSGLKRWALIAAAAALAGTQLLTYSRTGWLLLAVVGLLVVISRRRTLWSRRERSLTIAAIVVLISLAALPQTRQLFSGNSSQELQTSSEYRTALTEQAMEPGFFAPLGRSTEIVGPDGQTSIDNAYILVGWDWGYLGLLGLGVALVGTIVRSLRADDPLAVGFAATSAGLLVALTGVALFGQLQIFVFLILGAAAGTPLNALADRPPETPASRT